MSARAWTTLTFAELQPLHETKTNQTIRDGQLKFKEYLESCEGCVSCAIEQGRVRRIWVKDYASPRELEVKTRAGRVQTTRSYF